MGAYPASVSTFTVVGRLHIDEGDSVDVGADPDVNPQEGVSVTFTPQLSPKRIRVPGFGLVDIAPVAAVTDADGYVKTIGGDDVVLAYGGDPDITPTGWTWLVSIEATSVVPEDEFSIAGSAGGTVDLSEFASVSPADPGAEVVAWVSARDAAIAAKDDAEAAQAAAETAQAAAEAAQAAAEAVPTSNDAIVAALLEDGGSATRVAANAAMVQGIEDDESDIGNALRSTFASQLNGTGKSAAEINAWLAAAPVAFKVKRLIGDIVISAPLVFDQTDVHFDASGTSIRTSGDYPAITCATAQAVNLRNIKIVNSFAGERTTFDIDLLNPTKPLLFNVEVNLPNASTGKGGIRIRYDSGVAGNRFMPQLDKVWIRNGHLVVDAVTDGHMHDCWVWAPNTGARAAVEFINQANGWIVQGCDIVPPIDDGIGYYLEAINHTRFVGGYIDGNDAGLQTGYGVWLKNCGRITFSALGFWNVGRSGLVLEGSSHVKAIGCDFSKNNKQDANYPDIDLINSDYNTFLGNAHWAPDVRTNKGVIYREDVDSVGNRVDYITFDPAADYYARPVVQANAGTFGRNNRPSSLFPRVREAADIICPPAALISLPAAASAWPSANFAIMHRFHVPIGATYRYVNLHVEAGSGNFQVAVLRLSGGTFSDYTRVMDSGVVACTTGTKAVDLGATFLEPGEYAVAVWCDNTAATFFHGVSNAVQAQRMSAKVSSLAGGVPASGTVTWNGDRFVSGVSVGLSI